MTRVRTCLSLFSLALAMPAGAATLIHAGQLFDATGNTMRERVTVVVEGERIVAIEPGFRSPGVGDVLIDQSGATVLPGLMDMHVHLTQESSPRAELDAVKKGEADRAYDSVVYAQRTLDAGFTTVRNLGDSFGLSIALKRAIDAGKIPGPRIHTSGRSIGSTGGHVDASNSFGPFLSSDDPRLVTVCNGPERCREAVRQRYKDGSDSIKIAATGGVMSIARSGTAPQFTDDELEAIIATARDYGFRVAAHAHGTEGMKRAVRAGVDSIEHGTYMDDETMALMKQKGIYMVPTISAGRWVYEKAQIPGYFNSLVQPKALAIGPLIQQTFARALAAGVPIMFGTDCGVCAHGSNAREFSYMVEAGMPVLAAIRSATIVPARYLGIDDELGTLEPGKLADIIAIDGDPRSDVTALERVRFVMKAGAIVKDAQP